MNHSCLNFIATITAFGWYSFSIRQAIEGSFCLVNNAVKLELQFDYSGLDSTKFCSCLCMNQMHLCYVLTVGYKWIVVAVLLKIGK